MNLLHIHCFTKHNRFFPRPNGSGSYLRYKKCRCGLIKIKCKVSGQYTTKNGLDDLFWNDGYDVSDYHLSDTISKMWYEQSKKTGQPPPINLEIKESVSQTGKIANIIIKD